MLGKISGKEHVSCKMLAVIIIVIISCDICLSPYMYYRIRTIF